MLNQPRLAEHPQLSTHRRSANGYVLGYRPDGLWPASENLEDAPARGFAEGVEDTGL
ncbi:hypothetical protein GCM10011399_05980 [Subtercola lobariae]|uniref:Uncharacterized protein n=1 Tax=Subtercola lobariae TaxID=1588641 RepID=A0A917EUS3_9MICO|nr:hypothetical protein GCM10011399_05980 [Subtercola lobariae]